MTYVVKDKIHCNAVHDQLPLVGGYDGRGRSTFYTYFLIGPLYLGGVMLCMAFQFTKMAANFFVCK
jgi:hypothetical protein